MKKKLQPFPAKACKPKINYPCHWQYKIIAESSQAIRSKVAAIVTDREYSLTDSNVSRTGRYISMNLELNVDTEEQRLELYRLLAADPEIKVVL